MKCRRIADLDPVLFDKTGIGFKDKTCLKSRRKIRGVLDPDGSRIFNHIDDFHVFIQPDDIQGDIRIFHPEAPEIIVGKHKKHPPVFGQVSAIHQPLFALSGGQGKFNS